MLINIVMDFHLAFTPKKFPTTIRHIDKLLLIGSCFTENIGTKLKQHKFSVLENPNGILFNPISIAKSVHSYISNQPIMGEELFYQNECWNSWEHHSRFSHPDKSICLQRMNESAAVASNYILKAEWIFITVGSAFVYELENQQVVANCHKVPTDQFQKRLLSVAQVIAAFTKMLDELLMANAAAKIIFTVSPVRHLRDGFIENNRSKAALIQAVHHLVDTRENVFYFPAYELVMDDLRDYRFYAEDMVHPNYAATNYVWEKFVPTCMDDDTQIIMKEINLINAAKSHKPFQPSSQLHKKFLNTHLQKLLQLSKRYPYIDFKEELAYFQS